MFPVGAQTEVLLLVGWCWWTKRYWQQVVNYSKPFKDEEWLTEGHRHKEWWHHKWWHWGSTGSRSLWRRHSACSTTSRWHTSSTWLGASTCTRCHHNSWNTWQSKQTQLLKKGQACNNSFTLFKRTDSYHHVYNFIWTDWSNFFY